MHLLCKTVVLLTVVVAIRAEKNDLTRDLKVILPSGDKMSVIGCKLIFYRQILINLTAI